jgi:hypothetical protein
VVEAILEWVLAREHQVPDRRRGEAHENAGPGAEYPCCEQNRRDVKH